MAFQEHFANIFLTQNTLTDILGEDVAKEQLKSALLTNRHVLIHGPPGIGKTTLAKNVAKILPDIDSVKGEERFIRVQGSPDLTAEDLIGDIDPLKALKYGPTSKEAFTPGKIFKANNGILFFDEVNRCSEKLQNAMLQALEEGVATIGSYDVDLPANFIFIGTLNPQDTSTERLSDAFLDRFDIIEMSYPDSHDIEKQIVKSKESLAIEFSETLLDHVISFIREFRDPNKLVKMPSVRATLGIYERAKATAFLRGKKEVDVSDIYAVIVSVLAHRIELKPSLKYSQTPEDFVKQTFENYAKMHNLALDETEDKSDST